MRVGFGLWLCALTGCSGATFQKGVFRKPQVAYRVSVLPSWKQVFFRDNDLAFVDESKRFLIGLNSTCDGHKDAPLRVLANDLLIGFEKRQWLNQQELQLDARAALRSRLKAELDGVPVELELTVLKKDGCVFDLIYVAPHGRFSERQKTYESLLKAFTTEVS